jgi:hypothetical protein
MHFQEIREVSRKLRRFKKAAPYRENARHAAVLVHAIVEKLTACGQRTPVRTGSGSDRVLQKKMFALRTHCRLVACGPADLIFENETVF